MAEGGPNRNQPHTLEIESSRGTYPVRVGAGLLEHSWEHLGDLLRDRPVVIVTQRRIRRLYGKRLLASWPSGEERPAPVWLEIPQGEKAKTLPWLQRLCSRMARRSLPRSTVLVALGGGVVGDLAGFVAASYLRGIDWVQVPTTLLAQVDSSVGGKVAVNLPQGKNLVGAFYPPDAVLVDPATLGTLARRELLAGQAEVVKTALVRDPEFYSRCRRELPAPGDYTPFLVRSLELKAEVVARDEREGGLRMCLNLGHTMGHAIEAAGGYKRWVHGQAVALGLRYVFLLAARLGTLPRKQAEDVEVFLRESGISPPVPRLGFEGLLKRMQRDKKASARGIRWILPTGIGSWKLEEGVPDEDLAAAWEELQELDAGSRAG